MKTAKLIYMSRVALSQLQQHAGDSNKNVTATQVDGTWKKKGGEFRIWALGKQRLCLRHSIATGLWPV